MRSRALMRSLRGMLRVFETMPVVSWKSPPQRLYQPRMRRSSSRSWALSGMGWLLVSGILHRNHLAELRRNARSVHPDAEADEHPPAGLGRGDEQNQEGVLHLATGSGGAAHLPLYRDIPAG